MRGTGQRVAELSGFNERASRHGFIVVYPDSHGNRWNYLHGIPGAFAGPDDPGFLNKLTDTLGNTYSIAARRRYVVGISDGGCLAWRGAIPLQGRQGPVGALYVHGTEDRLVPWDGKTLLDSQEQRQVVKPCR